ncbi:MAG: asparagine synthase (glutamine-hydrolyzing) [Gammaproteobacteria bacterium]|nr:MAG: asparagine synthase (glutamine-hydrolyzing) [Gammaproteobacteria bacterium]
MCGISGYIAAGPVARDDIQRMNTAIHHRGPDGDGIELRDNVGFGHVRLSIIDLEGGHQPILSPDRQVWITFNGEIYNYRELRAGLEGQYDFNTHSDTEVILALYLQKGRDCVKQLRGMFAFAIYNFRDRSLFMARDHLGQKPLYYFNDGERLGFCSEIKGLLALDDGLRQLNHEALYEYLSLRIITAPRSMMRDIKKLPPGHCLSFKGGKLDISRYWDLDYRRKLPLSFDEALDALEQKLEETVRYHLVSDVPVGAFLSGGMDSSLIVAMMSKITGEPVKTFSGDVPYEGYSELPYCHIVGECCATDPHEMTIEPTLMRTLPDLVWHLDEPSDSLSTCMYHISALARKEVKVVLGGDGGDELFGGYDRYYGVRYASYYAMLPESVRRHVMPKLINLMPEGFWYKSISHQLKWMNYLSFFEGGRRYAKSLGYFYFSDQYRKQLYTEQFQQAVGMFDPESSIVSHYDNALADDMVDRMLYTDSNTRMVDHPVMISDRMTMAHGLESRAPFMDHKLAEFCAALPSNYKVKGRKLRHIQIELVRRYFPDRLVNRKKQGFSSALTYLLADEYQRIYQLYLQDSRLVQAGLIRHEAIKRLLDEHQAKKADHGQRLWQLCNAEIWYRMYIERVGKEQIREQLLAA